MPVAYPPAQIAHLGIHPAQLSERLAVPGCLPEPAAKPAEKDAQHEDEYQQCPQAELIPAAFAVRRI